MASTLAMIEEATYKQNDISHHKLSQCLKSHRFDKPGRQHEAVHPARELEHQDPLDARLAPRPVVRAASHAVVSGRGLVLVLPLRLGQSEVSIQVT